MPKFCLDFFAASTTPPSCKIVLRWSFYGMYLTLTALHITPKLFILKFVSRNIEVDNTEKKIGVKVKDEAKEVLDSGYLYYLFMHLHNTQFWQTNGLVYGSLQLKNLRVEDIKNLSIG